jgi:hypothetical protein
MVPLRQSAVHIADEQSGCWPTATQVVAWQQLALTQSASA